MDDLKTMIHHFCYLNVVFSENSESTDTRMTDIRIVASTASKLEEPYWRIAEQNPTPERIINDSASLRLLAEAVSLWLPH